jgi:hypothetical protein
MRSLRRPAQPRALRAAALAGIRARGVAFAAAWALLAAAASGDEVQEQLQRMDERITQLEQQLEATHDELAAAKARVAAQQGVIEQANLDAQDEEPSRLSRWIRETQFDGWVAASYWYNANRPKGSSDPEVGRDRLNVGNPQLGVDATGLAYFYHPDHNSFQVDQLWFKMVNEANAESRAGFGVDLAFGQIADALRGDPNGNGDIPAVFQAYAQYLAPLGPGVLVTAGRFATHIGAEYKETVYNFNVTNGLLNLQLSPTNHLGVTAKSWVGPVSVMVGVANDAWISLNRDLDDGKALLWGLGLDVSERVSLAINGLWGDASTLPGFEPDASPPIDFDPEAHEIGIVNLVVRWEPSDVLSTWLDLDYMWTQGLEAIIGGAQQRVPGEPEAYGAAAASRYAISPQTGFGFRAEVVYGRDNFLDPTLITGIGHHTLWSVTGTLDHTFAENFVVRIEGRYDVGERDGADAFFYRDRDRGEFRGNQFVGGVQAYYRF